MDAVVAVDHSEDSFISGDRTQRVGILRTEARAFRRALAFAGFARARRERFRRPALIPSGFARFVY
jgi:hypothetical protein